MARELQGRSLPLPTPLHRVGMGSTREARRMPSRAMTALMRKNMAIEVGRKGATWLMITGSVVKQYGKKVRAMNASTAKAPPTHHPILDGKGKRDGARVANGFGRRSWAKPRDWV